MQCNAAKHRKKGENSKSKWLNFLLDTTHVFRVGTRLNSPGVDSDIRSKREQYMYPVMNSASLALPICICICECEGAYG